MRTHLIRTLWLIAALAVFTVSSFEGVQAKAAVSGAQARTSSTAATRITTPMTIVRVARLLTRTPDKTGQVEVQLVNGAVIAIPAADENLVMQNAKTTPQGKVSGNCGDSWIYQYDKADEHPLKVYTGFTLKHHAIYYQWYYKVTGPDGWYLTANLAGGLALRSSWENTYSTSLDYPQGEYSAEVSKSSYAELWTGSICYSGGPTAKNELTSPDASVEWGLSTIVDTMPHATSPVRGMPAATAIPAFVGERRGVDPYSVIGKDTRKRVDNTTAYPYRAIVSLSIRYRSGSTTDCTGFLISSNTVVTAGHCLYTKGTGVAENVVATPGRNAQVSPFGYCLGQDAYSVTGWVYDQDDLYDYGAVKLNCSIGNEVGWFGFRSTSSSLTGIPVTITGYPNDKKPEFSMWTASGKIANTEQRQVLYTIPTAGEQSGSPVYSGYYALAIHTQGLSESHPHDNAGTRITQAAFDNLLAWRS
jgi:glutamyl endopeptidase